MHCKQAFGKAAARRARAPQPHNWDKQQTTAKKFVKLTGYVYACIS